MNVVSPFEGRLLTLLHFFLRRGVAELALRGDSQDLRVPSRLSRTALTLIQDTLAKGTALVLARAGGWQRARHHRGAAVVEGRLWERTPPSDLGLTFSRETLTFLIWATARDPHRSREDVWNPDVAALTLGDQVLLYFAYSALRQEGAHHGLNLTARPAFACHGLCRLAFPGDFESPKPKAEPDYALWTSDVGSFILEALHPEMRSCWLQLERSKEEMEEFGRMRMLGRAQECVLEGFLNAVESANRWDLARFLLPVAADLLTAGASGQNWVGQLRTVEGQRLADRAETHRCALVFLRAFDRLKTWERRARVTGYLDEGYAAAQLWLADWERHQGDLLYGRAQAILKHLDPMKSREEVS